MTHDTERPPSGGARRRPRGSSDRHGQQISSTKTQPAPDHKLERPSKNYDWGVIEVHDLPSDLDWLERHPEIIEAMVKAVLNGNHCLCCDQPLAPYTRRPVLAVVSPPSVTNRTYIGFSCEHCCRRQGAADAPIRAAQAMRDYVYDTPGRVELVHEMPEAVQ
jgi:hypothetical protein